MVLRKHSEKISVLFLLRLIFFGNNVLVLGILFLKGQTGGGM